MKLKDWILEIGLPLPEDMLQELAKGDAELNADLPHSQKFLRLVAQGIEAQQASGEDEPYKWSVKQAVRQVTLQEERDALRRFLAPFREVYAGLTLPEQAVAFKHFSSAARAADPEKDKNTLQAFERAMQEGRKAGNYPRIKTTPRLIICESDLPFAKGFAALGHSAVFVSSDLIERLKPEQLKAIMKHELSHVNDLSLTT